MKKIRIFVLKRRTAYLALSVMFLIFFGIVGICIKIKAPFAARFTDPNKNSGIIVIDPGHGGIDGGTSLNGLLEKDINLDISLKARDYLEQEGLTVVMTRQTDISLEDLSDISGSRYIKDLNARIDKIDNSNAQMFLSIHVNCYLKNPRADGSIVFYSTNFAENETLAYCVQRALNSMVVEGKKRTTHDPQIGDYFLLRNSGVPGIIVETAFISNRVEWELLMSEKFKDDIAKNIVKGVKQYLKDVNNVLKSVKLTR